MDIYLDHDPLETDADTLQAVIDAGLKKLGESDRLIVEVRVNGDALTAEQIGAALTEALSADEVQLITAEKHVLAEQTLLDVRDALKAASEDQQQAARLLQEDRASEAMDHVRRALAVWQQAEQSVAQTSQLLSIDLPAVEVGDQTAEQIVALLVERLTQVVEQMKNQDWIGLSDSLAYDLAETTDQWVSLVETLSGLARAGRPES